jgi:chlorite dismutase
MMAEHLKIGHRYPGVKIHTGYSFGIDDQEFVVAFESELVGEFLDLVEELRGSEASAYTARDVPVFTGIRMPLERILDQIDGTPPA